MAQTTNRWKLGLFVSTGFAVAVAAVVWLGASRFRKETLTVVTYFNESVQGLDVGAPVKFRGVTLGSVGRIDLAPDQRHVAATLEIDLNRLQELGISQRTDAEVAEDVARQGHMGPPGLRTQLASAGITGVKFISTDIYPPDKHPLPKLSFAPPEAYIPSTPSTLKGVEEAIWFVLDQLPDTNRKVMRLIDTVTVLAHDVDGALLSANVAEVSTSLRKLADEVRGQLQRLDAPALTAEVQAGVSDLRGLMQKLEAVAANADRLMVATEEAVRGVETDALVADLRRTAGAWEAVAQGADGLTGEVRLGLVELQETLREVRSLADSLERDPGALLRGRAPDVVNPAGGR